MKTPIPTHEEVKIITNFLYPPIPIRENDWCAYFDADGAEACKYGWGKTEEDAIRDLIDNYEEPA